MITRQSIQNTTKLMTNLVRYNLKVIFGGKFPYFLLAAGVVFLLFTLLNLASARSQDLQAFYLLLMPGLLLVFYPTAFGIQNDVNARMIEILFGIPNYRYKVWLFRLLLINIVVFVILFLLAVLFNFTLEQVPVWSLSLHLMAPIIFIGSLAFCLSTITRNGNGTAVVLIIILMGFWMLKGQLGGSEIDIFINPFQVPDDTNVAIWAEITTKSRLYLAVGSIIAILWGLLNLQRREKFIG